MTTSISLNDVYSQILMFKKHSNKYNMKTTLSDTQKNLHSKRVGTLMYSQYVSIIRATHTHTQNPKQNPHNPTTTKPKPNKTNNHTTFPSPRTTR